MLIIPLVGPKSCQTSLHASCRLLRVHPRITFGSVLHSDSSLFIPSFIVFFFETRLPTLFWPRNSPHPPRHPRPRLSLPSIKAGMRAARGKRPPRCLLRLRRPSTHSCLRHVCLFVFTTLVFFLYSHEVAPKRFPCIAFSFSFSNFLHALHMRFFGILFSQLFYPFGDGPCSFRNSRNHCVDPFPRLGTLFSSSLSSSSFRRHDD